MAFVEVTKKDHIAVVTMNRPEALNALNKAVFTDLEVALDDVEKDDEVYVVIITGAGRAFIAGADIGEMAPMNVSEGLAFSELGNRILMRVDMMEKPTIAAVNGFALGGGCEMALACDIRIASEKAKFGQPEVGLGIIPGFGGTQRMARIIGTGPAMELIYTADTIDAQRALEIGKNPVEVGEAPGFVVNRILFPMINEAIIVLENGIASKEDIDTAMMYGANHKMGPLALADLVGLDICLAIMETIFTETGDSKYRPALTMKKMVRAGLLGQKTGEGFYKY